MNPPRTYPAGVTSRIDVEHSDVDAAADFYSRLFGWSCSEVTPPGADVRYLVASLDGLDVAGLGGPVDGAGAWSSYVAVDDVAAVAARVSAAGGQVVSGPDDVGPAGRSAACADPAGAPFRLWQAGRRLGAQITNSPGTWNFSNLHTRDLSGATDFYTDVFGWVFDDQGFATMIRVPGYGRHLADTVDPGIFERQATAPPGFADAIGWLNAVSDDEEPHWHVSFTVADRDVTAAAAERLGGTVLASEDTEWTRTAEVCDPQGAVFTASQFAPPSSWD
jgi:uncharacterized protein